MKKFLLAVFGIAACGAASAAGVPWWLQPTICQLNPAKCYAMSGAGFDSEMWDALSGCRGMKIICGEALVPQQFVPKPMSKTAIASGNGINVDFDLNVLSSGNDCFGVRKTVGGGGMVIVGGQQVKVWCAGILPSPDEQVQYGEITYGAEPTCPQLAAQGYVALLNSTCYGKYFDPDQYYIECAAGKLIPERIVALNGAIVYSGVQSGSITYPTTLAAAEALFGDMLSDAAKQKCKHFGNC